MTNAVDIFNDAQTGVASPSNSVRNYDLSRGTALVGLLDHPLYPPYIRDSLHTHNCMEIGLCLSGHGHIAIGDRDWRFSQGTVVIIPKDVRHAQQNEDARMTHWVYVLIDTQVFLAETPRHRRLEAQNLLNRLPGGIYLAPEQVTREIRSTIEELFRIYREKRTLDSLEMDALTRLLLSRLSWVPEVALVSLPGAAPIRRAVEPALQFVAENYTLDVRISEMASACAMSESYFRKVFTAAMEMSPVEYLNRYRINRSMYLLASSDETVLTIAGLSGFASISSFNRNFEKYVGVSPGQWRRNAHRD